MSENQVFKDGLNAGGSMSGITITLKPFTRLPRC